MACLLHDRSLEVTLDEAASGSYVARAIGGQHGHEVADAALRAGDFYFGAPRRTPSFPSNTWESFVRRTHGNPDLRVDAWLTAYPVPWLRRK